MKGSLSADRKKPSTALARRGADDAPSVEAVKRLRPKLARLDAIARDPATSPEQRRAALLDSYRQRMRAMRTYKYMSPSDCRLLIAALAERKAAEIEATLRRLEASL